MPLHVKQRRPRVSFNRKTSSPGSKTVSSNRLASTSSSSRSKLSSIKGFQKKGSQNQSIASISATSTMSSIPEILLKKHLAGKANLPSLHPYGSRPTLSDDLETETSIARDETIEVCLDELRKGVPPLDREGHVEFLKMTMEPKPKMYVALDSNRPWVVYWGLAGLKLLGENIDEYEDRVVQHVLAAQHPDGGIGSGHGQLSHIAPTYAAILSLCMLGPQALGCVDRRRMWKWLGKLKHSDGGIAVTEGGEVDVRGAYCCMTVIALLNLPLELPEDCPAREAGLSSFTDNLKGWLSKCQTHEGGISASPGVEAHGGYAFCALACASILGDPSKVIPECWDVPLLISWLSARQDSPEGGFSGRTNKLVDGCYSHWVGGCWPLIDAALEGMGQSMSGPEGARERIQDREGLLRYILCCCQSEYGGLRDKPGKFPDGYHSCYVLAGLGGIQHGSRFVQPEKPVEAVLTSAFRWEHAAEGYTGGGGTGDGEAEIVLFKHEDTVEAFHPVFVIPYDSVARVYAHRANMADI